MILITGIRPGEGADCGRALLAETLAYRAAYKAGASSDNQMTDTAAWKDHQLAAGCLWLKDIVHLAGAALKLNPLAHKPDPRNWETPSLTMIRSWQLAHEFLAECYPWLPGGVEICCAECLQLMTLTLCAA